MYNLFYPSKTEDEKQNFEQQFKAYLQKLTEFYVKYYGEKYRKQIEENIAAATFIHIGHVYSIATYDEAMRSEFYDAVQNKLQVRFIDDYENKIGFKLAGIISGAFDDDKTKTAIMDKWLKTDLSLYDFYKNCNKKEKSTLKDISLDFFEAFSPKPMFSRKHPMLSLKNLSHEFRIHYLGCRKSDFKKVEPQIKKLRTDWLDLYAIDAKTDEEVKYIHSMDSYVDSLKFDHDALDIKFFGTTVDSFYKMKNGNLDLVDKTGILLSSRNLYFTQEDDQKYFAELLPERMWHTIDCGGFRRVKYCDPKEKELLTKAFDEFIYHSPYSAKIKAYMDRVAERDKIIGEVCDEEYQDHFYDFAKFTEELKQFWFNKHGGSTFDSEKIKYLQVMLEGKPKENGNCIAGYVSVVDRRDWMMGWSRAQYTAIYENYPISYTVHEINHLLSPETALPHYLNEVFTDYVALCVTKQAEKEESFQNVELYYYSAYGELFCLKDLFKKYKKEFVKAYLEGDITDLRNELGDNLDKISNICNEYFYEYKDTEKRGELRNELEKTVEQIVGEPEQKEKQKGKSKVDLLAVTV